jgi:tetratricopeptide (TPR) repeat protein
MACRGTSEPDAEKMKPFRLILFLTVIICSPSLPLTAQDHPQDQPKVLPFQQQAPQPVDEDKLAMQFFQAHDYEKAAELYEKLYEKRPAPHYYMYYLYSLLELNDFAKAEKLVKAQRKNDPDGMRYLVDLGYILFRKGETERARKLYDEALQELLPEQQQVMNLANAFIQKGENAYAIKAYLKGRELLRGRYSFSMELSTTYERMGNFSGMFEELLNLLVTDPNYENTVQTRLQNVLLNDPENEKNEIFRTTLLTRVRENPDIPEYSMMLWWYSIQQKDFSMALIQAKALDRRLRESGDRIVQLAQLAASNGQFDVAAEAWDYIVAKGPQYPYYSMSRVERLNILYFKAVSERNPLREEMEDITVRIGEELALSGENAQTVSLMQTQARIYAYYLDRPDDAIDILYRSAEMKDITPVVKASCKILLADILLLSGTVWEATLLYQQVYQDFKHDVIGQEAKFKNAKLSFYIGEFNWAKAQADVLKAATSKLIANDALALSVLVSENFDPDSGTVALTRYAQADLFEFRHEYRKALQTLDSIQTAFLWHPILDDVLFRKADIYLTLGQPEVADSLFKQVTELYPDEVLADKALFRRAWLREEMDDKETARTLYEELIEDFPGSIYVIEARKRFRILRGDNVSN